MSLYNSKKKKKGKMHYYLTCEGKILFVQKYPKQLDNKTGTDT